jgi:hypothetical protein
MTGDQASISADRAAPLGCAGPATDRRRGSAPSWFTG